ncbi:odorant receptor 10-like [Ptiloglossa arizonensis]|uniref:odorant receptor 10-like n=1 Tax=Ptiloglossa arizonensis TaxID=3350558 RepID=UPI003FA09F4A
MNTSSNKDFTYAMLPLKVLAWPVGTWPLQKYTVFSILRTIVAVCLLLLMMIIVQTEMYLDHSDAEKNLDALVLVSCGILAVWKITLFRIFSDGLVVNFSSAVKDYNELNGDEKRAIVRWHAYMGRVACASVIGFSYIGSTLFMTVPMLSENEPVKTEDINTTQDGKLDFPIPSEQTLEILQISESLYPAIFFMEYTMLLFTSTGNLGSDSLFYGIIFHLCGQAELLKLDFTKLVNESENTVDRFNVLTTRHRYLLQLFEKLNDTISNILIIQLFTSCVLICTSGFQFIRALNVQNIVLTIKTLIVATTLLTQLFAYSYVGEYLKNQMEGIGYSAYSSRWYDIPSNISRDIVFVLMRVQVPVHLRAGKYLVVNMETYMNIVRTSISYLSILRVMIT